MILLTLNRGPKSKMNGLFQWVYAFGMDHDIRRAISTGFEEETMTSSTVKFTTSEVKKYLDECIRHWRSEHMSGNEYAKYYLDAYRSVSVSLFGEVLPTDEEGLYDKFVVSRVDEEPIEDGAEYFVLRLDNDDEAVQAIMWWALVTLKRKLFDDLGDKYRPGKIK